MRSKDEQRSRELSPLACALWGVAFVLALFVVGVVITQYPALGAPAGVV